MFMLINQSMNQSELLAVKELNWSQQKSTSLNHFTYVSQRHRNKNIDKNNPYIIWNQISIIMFLFVCM